MSSEPPRPGAIPGWGTQPADAPTEPTPAPQQAPAPQPTPAAQPAPGTGAIPGWGTPPAEAPAPQAAPAPATQPAPGTGAIPGWGQQPAEAPAPQAAPAPATQPASAPQPAPAPGTGAVPGWGTQPAAPSPVPSAPAPAPAPVQAPPAPVPSGPPTGAAPGWGQPSGAPGAVPPGPPTGPASTPPGGWNPQPAKPSGGGGCLKVFLILVALAFVAFVLLVIGLLFIGRQIASSVGIDENGSFTAGCTLIDDRTLSDAMGAQAQAIQLTGLYDATIGLILDKRVLPNAEDCWITSDATNPVGRIARYTGSDAASVFDQERQKAQPTSQDQGGGVSLENPGYFGGDVSGIGDQAFCTGLSPAIQAGVLVRKGDTLVYVSLSGPSDGTVPSFDTTGSGVVTAPSICEEAQSIARRMLP